MPDKIAFFWITSGGRFNDEASQSASSCMEIMGDVSRFLFSDFSPRDGSMFTAFGTEKVSDSSGPWYLKSTEMMVNALKWLEKEGFLHVVYMDTDTTILEPVYDLFDLAMEFEFSGARAPGRKTCPHMDNYYSSSLFPEINMGVNPMYVPSAIHLWETALEAYKKYASVYGNNDQGPLRDALISHLINAETFRIYIMPPEYNCRFIMPCFLNGAVKILHGRNPDIHKVAADINARTGMRLWKPYSLID